MTLISDHNTYIYMTFPFHQSQNNSKGIISLSNQLKYMNAIWIIHFSYKIISSQAIKPTAFNSELGTVPVTFHMEVRKKAYCRMQTICYSSIVHLRQSQSQWNRWNIRAHTLCRNQIAPCKFRGHLESSHNHNTLILAKHSSPKTIMKVATSVSF